MDYRVSRKIFAAHVTSQTPFRFQTDAKFDAQSRSTVEISHIALTSSSSSSSSLDQTTNSNNSNCPVFVQVQTLTAPSGAVERHTVACLTPAAPVVSGLRIRLDVDGYAEFHVVGNGSVVLYGLQLSEDVQDNEDPDMFDTFDEGLFRLIGGLQE